MSPKKSPSKRSRWAKTAAYGFVSAGLYAALYSYQADVVEIAGRGGWAAAMPVGVALVFSTVHGAFTSGFWDALGVQAKK